MHDAPPVDDALIRFAVDIAREAGELTLGWFRQSDLTVEGKSDGTPVTIADRSAERLLRDRIAAAFPDDGIVGEEEPDTAGRSGRTWILDPIDGTKSFIHHVPLFGTLIGLELDGQMVAGVCRMPALDEVAYGGMGLGAWWQQGGGDPRPARVSSVQRLDQALFCTTTITRWRTLGRQDVFDRLCGRSSLARGWSDCYGHLLVATGRADVMVDPVMNIWDAAALLPIVQEAGGHFLTLDGRPVVDGGNGLSVNAEIRDEVLGLIASNE